MSTRISLQGLDLDCKQCYHAGVYDSSACCLQVSVSGQAVVFVVRTMSWSLASRAGLWTYIAFFLAQVRPQLDFFIHYTCLLYLPHWCMFYVPHLRLTSLSYSPLLVSFRVKLLWMHLLVWFIVDVFVLSPQKDMGHCCAHGHQKQQFAWEPCHSWL